MSIRIVWLGDPISFCYIDNNRSYDFAERNFENCNKYLETGGFILSDGPVWRVKKVVAEIQESGRHERVIKNPSYHFRKK